MPPSKENKPIHIRCEPVLFAEAKAVADESFGGNLALYTRTALKKDTTLRRLYGPRYELVISELIDGAEAEKALAA